MTLLYPQEHLNCYCFDKGENPRLEIVEVAAGADFVRDLTDNEIVFLLKGRFRLSYGKLVNEEIGSGVIMLFPPGSRVKAEIVEDVRFIVCRVRGIVQLCECLSLERLHFESPSVDEDFQLLPIRERIHGYISHFVDCVEDGLRCNYYFETKTKELFFMLRAYYAKEELAGFFSPLLSKDSSFMNLMYTHFREAKSVQDLIRVSYYSESGFKKQFQRVFGTSASEWLRERKASLIFQDLNHSPLSLKELAEKHHFSSVSSFSTFCTSQFGRPPGKIRLQGGRNPEISKENSRDQND